MLSGLEPIPVTPQKHDPAWKHCEMFKNGEKVLLKCIYCGKIFKGGGIHRIKEHLANQKGNAATCPRVLPDVRDLMLESLNGVVVKKKKKQKLAEEITGIRAPSDGVDAFNSKEDLVMGLQASGPNYDLTSSSNLLASQEEDCPTAKRSSGRRKRGRPSTPNPVALQVIPPVTCGATTQSFAPGKANRHVHMAIGRFLYDIGVPLNAVNSAYLQPMIDAIASQGPGVVAPSYSDIRGWILKSAVEEVKNDIDQYMGAWGRTGCSLLADEWSSDKGGTLIKFSVYSPEGTIFLKSVDISEVKDSPHALFEILKDAVEELGVRNVLQVITCCSERYLIAGSTLVETFPTLYWAPCAAQCVDMMLEDFGKLEWIDSIIEQARSVTRFIYNHSFVLNMLRRFTFGNDLVVPGVTRFTTSFLTLKRISNLKQNLQQLVTSQEWVDCPFSKKEGGLLMLDSFTNDSFWSSIHLVVRLTDPLMRVLRIARSDKRPGMGFIYAGIYRAKQVIKNELVKRKDYAVYWNIIESRWEQQRRVFLQTAGFYLNPKFFYSNEGDMHNDIVSGMFDCIEKLVPEITLQDKIIKELNSYKNAIGDFGRKMAVRARDTMLPAEWWSTYGAGCPNLSRLAVRILSQTCTSKGQKKYQIPLEQMHGTRNCLEHQRIMGLLFVQNNLQLKQENLIKDGQHFVDPISVDTLHSVEDWITEKNACLDDYGSSNWMALDPPASNTMLLGTSDDDFAELGAGFDDYEVFSGFKDSEDDNSEDNVTNNTIDRHPDGHTEEGDQF